MGPTKSAAPPHPHVTVEDVWRGALPENSQLVGGESGLRREVVWCTALRARPPAFTLRGGELLLIDPEVLAAVDSRLTLARLLESLGGQGPGPGRAAGAALYRRSTGRTARTSSRLAPATERTCPCRAWTAGAASAAARADRCPGAAR